MIGSSDTDEIDEVSPNGDSEMKTCSVVICTLDNHIGLKECIRSLNAQTVLPIEVIVVHGNENSQTKQVFKEGLNPRVKGIYLTAERSLVRQRNIGSANAQGDVVVFLDDDVVLERDYLEQLLILYSSEEFPEIGGAGGTITNMPTQGMLSRLFSSLFLLSSWGQGGCLTRSGFAKLLIQPTQITRVEVLSGCNMSYTKEVLAEFQFDDRLHKNWLGDDSDMSYRVSRKFRVFQTPFARLEHNIAYRGGSARTYEGELRIAKMTVVNHLYFFKKYFDPHGLQWTLYIWSELGLMISYMLKSIATRSLSPLRGWVTGWKEIAFRSHSIKSI